MIPEGGFRPAPAIPQPNIYPMEWRVEQPEARRDLRAVQAPGVEPGRPALGRPRPGRLHPRAAARDDVLVRRAGQLRRLRAAGLRPGDDPRLREARGRPGPQVLLLDHPRRDEPRGVLPAGDPAADARRAARLRAHHRPGTGRPQQHRLAVPQRRPLLERLRRLARQVPAGGAVHLVHDGRGGVLDAVPRHGRPGPPPGVPGDVHQHRPGRVPPPADLPPAAGEGLAGPRRRPQAADHPAAARRLRVPVDDPVGAAATSSGSCPTTSWPTTGC